ncbi:AtuA-related protein [Pollutimonas harenae]|uniref:AtuA-like ferredoxin-fold domain-containing protein n=1 Tax=Pollutimonas harenae TaxID=657015 RepID=A0A853H278_9BURK|nr:hypothetical protein [Pollutimonas harenae]NYT85909.1 hypothetical protein [Pollutimonas harenae]TEA70962.1 hypothetical protein ERD84_09935 [Pollutimonas harenae]
MKSSDTPLTTLPLYRLAHSRSGDKGNISNISVIAYKPEYFPLLEAQLTEAALLDWFAYRKPSRVQRYLIESIHALNFVLHDVLDGGVNDALNLDTHGKALSFHLLDFPISLESRLAKDVPDIST